ncbi:MAG: hypothetical protein KatS3mg102_2126 [Planctomycetota bacterium]|nr:MAG: hypothetical protein KatS3mg102_2126 [Planctomycetota bacterium]
MPATRASSVQRAATALLAVAALTGCDGWNMLGATTSSVRAMPPPADAFITVAYDRVQAECAGVAVVRFEAAVAGIELRDASMRSPDGTVYPLLLAPDSVPDSPRWAFGYEAPEDELVRLFPSGWYSFELEPAEGRARTALLRVQADLPLPVQLAGVQLADVEGVPQPALGWRGDPDLFWTVSIAGGDLAAPLALQVLPPAEGMLWLAPLPQLTPGLRYQVEVRGSTPESSRVRLSTTACGQIEP